MKKIILCLLIISIFATVTSCNFITEFVENLSVSSVESDEESQDISDTESIPSEIDDEKTSSKRVVMPEILTPYVKVSPEKYYAFSRLTNKQKEIYNGLKELAMTLSPTAFKAGKDDDESRLDVHIAHTALRNDNPDMFWIPNGYLTSGNGTELIAMYAIKQDGKLTSFYHEKYNTPAKINAANKKIAKKVRSELIPKIKPNMSDYDIQLIIHNWLCEISSYDSKAVKALDKNQDEALKKYFTSFNILGNLLKGKAVCEGYSRTMQYLCNLVGIESNVVSGNADNSSFIEAHMWNIIKIGGQWYFSDVTWNDSGKSPWYTYFNLDEENMELSHHPSKDIAEMSEKDWRLQKGTASARYNFLPECTSLKANYHKKNGTWIDAADDLVDQLIEIIEKTANNGEKNVEVFVESGIPVNIDELVKYSVTQANEDIDDYDKKISSYIISTNPTGLKISME